MCSFGKIYKAVCIAVLSKMGFQIILKLCAKGMGNEKIVLRGSLLKSQTEQKLLNGKEKQE